jgi:adenosylcobinamide kinase/adenosylcobinamide-phosphate guanylyltransferase
LVDRSVEAGKRVVFVLGGARSGKSGFALKLSAELPGQKTYLATAEPFDTEMAKRIERHKSERPADWDTIEEPTNIAAAIKGVDHGSGGVILLDCLTLWLANLVKAGQSDEEIFLSVEGLKEACEETGSSVVAVSNEVGSGIVPDNAMARRFRDLAGIVNQRMAEFAGEVYFVAAGLPVRLK